ncbi:hypothetical protein EV13_0296 [Prochlorococcus sp. MIT 0702]|nr:hypothetical protein EV12_1292 [Prochlorococcus sp. MIT 0701]KGG30420.1 hypothetical protein EV13_0296 [Prochlorococcus sp. MIT 0702]KGG36530.1 hypothetical protein EV14_0263 [Prochlorococcus sp. MIT 0703]
MLQPRLCGAFLLLDSVEICCGTGCRLLNQSCIAVSKEAAFGPL